MEQRECSDGGVATKLDFGPRGEVAHRVFSVAMLSDKGRLGVAQLGSDLQHQTFVRKSGTVQQHDPCGIAAKGTRGEGIDNIVFHITY